MDPTANAPFMRQDKYGEIGTSKLAFADNFALHARAVVLVPVRLLCCFLCVVCTWCYCFLCRLLPPQLGSFVIGAGCRVLARCTALSAGLLYVKYEVAPGCEKRTWLGRDAVPLVVSNHVSWLDIMLISSLYTPSYVSKIEVKRVPIVSGVTAAVGSIFVDRKKEKAAAESNGTAGPTASDLITERLREKHRNPHSPIRPLCIFPEGTTTNGRYLLPFHTGAFRAGVPVKPVLLFYDRSSNVDLAYETISITRHLFLVLANLWHSARVVELPTYTPSEEEIADASKYAEGVRQYMATWSAKLGRPLKLSDSTYRTKQAYHAWLKEVHHVDENGIKKRQ